MSLNTVTATTVTGAQSLSPSAPSEPARRTIFDCWPVWAPEGSQEDSALWINRTPNVFSRNSCSEQEFDAARGKFLQAIGGFCDKHNVPPGWSNVPSFHAAMTEASIAVSRDQPIKFAYHQSEEDWSNLMNDIRPDPAGWLRQRRLNLLASRGVLTSSPGSSVQDPSPITPTATASMGALSSGFDALRVYEANVEQIAVLELHEGDDQRIGGADSEVATGREREGVAPQHMEE